MAENITRMCCPLSPVSVKHMLQREPGYPALRQPCEVHRQLASGQHRPGGNRNARPQEGGLPSQANAPVQRKGQILITK